MAITDIIKDIAPEFDNEIVAHVERFIGYAELQVSSNAFGERYNIAVAYLACHMMSLAGRNDDEGTNGQVGNLTQKKEGDLSASFALPNAFNNSNDATLMMTSYGIEYMRLRNLCVIAPGVYSGC